jgi:hypothetical protein
MEIEIAKIGMQKEIVLASERRLFTEIIEEIYNEIDNVIYESSLKVNIMAMNNAELMTRISRKTVQRLKLNNHEDKKYIIQLYEAGMLSEDDAVDLVENCNDDTQNLTNFSRDLKTMHQEVIKNIVATRNSRHNHQH